jgi:hypothetical protein
MNIETDNKKNRYINVKPNVRVTLVRACNRPAEKNWAGGDTIRIQAYVGDGSNTVMRGAELPLGPANDHVLELLGAICELLRPEP